MHILANDTVTTLSNELEDSDSLWISADKLEGATGFILKAEGACLGDLCVPIRRDEDNEMFKTQDGTSWVNVSLLAAKLKQPLVADEEEMVWSFGTVPSERESTLESAIAPNFAVADRDGKTIRLSDYRGKKVLLVTWASW